MIGEVEQRLDRLYLESQLAGVPDEAETANVGLTLGPPVAFRSGRRREKTPDLVESYRGDLDRGMARQIPDGEWLHALAPLAARGGTMPSREMEGLAMSDAAIPDPIEKTPTRLRVSGMDCASCATKIENAVRRLPGIEDIDVSVSTKTLTLRHGAGNNAATIAATVRSLGYAAASPSEAVTLTQPKNLHRP